MVSKIISTYKDAFDGLSKEVWQLAFMMLVNRIGTLILPFLTLYATQDLGWSTTDGGIAAAAFGFGSLAGTYIGGIMTDRIGYYKTMAFGLFSAAILFFVTQYFFNFYFFCAALFIGSMAADTLRPALYSGLSFITDETTQTRAISLLRMSFNLGIAIGPAVAGVFVVYTGYRSIFIIDSLTCLIAGIYLLRVLKNYEKPKTKEEKVEIKATDVRSPYRDVPFLVFMGSSLLMLIAFFQIICTIPLYIKEELMYTEKAVGLFFTANGLIICITEMLLIRYIEKKGYDKMNVLIIGAIMMGVALAFLAMPSVYLIPLILYTLLVSFGEIINFPYLSTTAMDRSSASNRGKYMGMTTMLFSIALIIAPILGTTILDRYGFDTLWIVMFGISMVGVGGYVVAKRLFEGEILE